MYPALLFWSPQQKRFRKFHWKNHEADYREKCGFFEKLSIIFKMEQNGCYKTAILFEKGKLYKEPNSLFPRLAVFQSVHRNKRWISALDQWRHLKTSNFLTPSLHRSDMWASGSDPSTGVQKEMSHQHNRHQYLCHGYNVWWRGRFGPLRLQQDSQMPFLKRRGILY